SQLLDLAESGSLAAQLTDRGLNQYGFCVVEALKGPSVEPEAGHFFVAADLRFDHLEDTRLASAPIAMDADRQRALPVVLDQLDDGLGNRLVIQKINGCFVVRYQHLRNPRPRPSLPICAFQAQAPRVLRDG